MHTTQELIESIRARGGKVTPQRLAIHTALQAGEGHPTAETVYERIRETMPTISLATVYKTLNELVAVNELRRFDVDGVSHFDTRTDPHAHAVCLNCSAIMDVALHKAMAAPEVPGFRIVGQTQTYYGYCASCGADERDSR